MELKKPDVELLAAHVLDAERDDFHWESRFDERHLGAYESLDDEPEELDRLAIIGYLKGRWHTAICIVDGEGCLFDMLNLQHHESAGDARNSYVTLRSEEHTYELQSLMRISYAVICL